MIFAAILISYNHIVTDVESTRQYDAGAVPIEKIHVAPRQK
jgi:hypothetical protein